MSECVSLCVCVCVCVRVRVGAWGISFPLRVKRPIVLLPCGTWLVALLFG